MVKKQVISWDGQNIPDGLKGLPPGQYEVEPVGSVATLTEAEEAGIVEALKQLDAGQGKSLAEVIAQIRRKSS